MSVYLDHAATTPLRQEVLDAMQPYLTEHFGNPSSIHGTGRRARLGLDEARETVARIVGAKPREIVFTSGGTEADNLAIKGAAWAASADGRRVVSYDDWIAIDQAEIGRGTPKGKPREKFTSVEEMLDLLGASRR